MKNVLIITLLLSSFAVNAQDKEESAEAFIIQELLDSQLTMKFLDKAAALKSTKGLSKPMAEFVDLAIAAQQIQQKKWYRCDKELNALRGAHETGTDNPVINQEKGPKGKSSNPSEASKESNGTKND